MKSKQLKQTEAIARNERHRAKYVASAKKEHPKAGPDDWNAVADHKIGIPVNMRESSARAAHAAQYAPK